MDNEILTTIITLEREIQERLAAEEQRAARMLSDLKAELDEEARQEEERLQDACRSALSDAEREARSEAEEVLQRARAKAKELEDSDDEALKACVARHLPAIMQERGP